MSENTSRPLYAGQNAVLDGKEENIHLGENVSIWHNAVIRADSDQVIIGDGTNIQDGCVVHEDPGYPVILGKNVSVGHGAILHGCQVGDNTVIGMGAIVMNGAKVGKNCLLAAGTLVSEHKQIPDGSLVMGVPGKVVRTLSPEEIAGNEENARHYIEKAKERSFFRK